MDREEYTKEELLELLSDCVTRFDLEIRFGSRVAGVSRQGDLFVVATDGGQLMSRYVVMAPGQRGTPRKLGVPGEERSNVMYRLIDAEAYRDQRILVVGGGDSAVEAAIGLSRNGRNKVTLSYRKDRLMRIKHKNAVRIEERITDGGVSPIFSSQVVGIGDGHARLATSGGEMVVENDFVFVFIGGVPPLPLLKSVGMRFGGEEPARPPQLRVG